jgi:AcrR family transcriptional regulator
MNHVTVPRATRKLQTRQALLDAALRLIEQHTLSSISLREVTRAAGIVPAAFYRHFPDMDSLGVALVEESLEPLRVALRSVRAGLTDSDEIIEGSVRVLADQVRQHPDLFRFLARERHGGVRRVREAIRDQLQRFADELARDLVASDIGAALRLREWLPVDVHMFTGLVVNQMVLTAAVLLEPPEGRPADQAVLEVATTQLRLVVLGAAHWLDEAAERHGGR